MAEQVAAVEVRVDSSQAVSSMAELRQNIQKANDALISAISKFGEASVEAQEAARQVANYREQLNAANQLTQVMNPAQPFANLIGTLQGVTGGIAAVQGAMALFGGESKAVEEVLVKVNAAMALASGITAIKEAAPAFAAMKTAATTALNGIKTGIASTGIGLLVIALGTVVAYWDEIKEAVTGVSSEQLRQNQILQDTAQASQDKLKDLDYEYNIKKLQGKTEKEILQEKLAQYDVTIKDAEAALQSEMLIQKKKEDNTQRNFDITKKVIRGAIEFATMGLRLLAAPIDALITTANTVSETLGMGTITSLNLNEEISNLNEEISSYATSILFDPEEVRKEGEKANKEALDNLKKLKSDRAGVQLQINKIDEDGRKKKEDNNVKEKKSNDDKLKQIEEANAQSRERQRKLEEEAFLMSIKDENRRAQIKLQIDYENQRKQINQSKAAKEQKEKELAALDEKYRLENEALLEEQRKQEEEKANEARQKALKNEQDTFDIAFQARMAREQNEFTKRQEEEAVRYQKELDNLYNLLNNKEISQQDFDTRYAAYKSNHELNIQKIAEDSAKAQDEIDKKRQETRQQIAEQSSVTINKFADVVGRQTAAGKVLAIASATMDTYSAANKALNANYGIFGPFAQVARFASVAATVAMGIKNIKQIASTKVPGAAGGNVPNASNVTASVTSPLSVQASTTMLDQNQVNQMASATARAFVVESDVSGNQERIRRLNRAARIN